MKPASHVIPAWAGVLERNLWEAVQRREKQYVPASTALDPMPFPTGLRGDDIVVEACNNLKNT